MKLNDYEWGMRELMNDKDYLYDTLSRDLYFLGKVLNKKYMLLRHFTYKLASDPSFGNPIWEPTEENFYCKKNY